MRQSIGAEIINRGDRGSGVAKLSFLFLRSFALEGVELIPNPISEVCESIVVDDADCLLRRTNDPKRLRERFFALAKFGFLTQVVKHCTSRERSCTFDPDARTGTREERD